MSDKWDEKARILIIECVPWAVHSSEIWPARLVDKMAAALREESQRAEKLCQVLKHEVARSTRAYCEALRDYARGRGRGEGNGKL